MIDLICHGLALRKKLKSPNSANLSANQTPDESKFSANSAVSAMPLTTVNIEKPSVANVILETKKEYTANSPFQENDFKTVAYTLSDANLNQKSYKDSVAEFADHLPKRYGFTETSNDNILWLNQSTRENLFNCFFAYTENIGIELLPDDKIWLKKICYTIPITKIKILLNKYIEYWCDTMNGVIEDHIKQNAARYKANDWLRRTIISPTGKNNEQI